MPVSLFVISSILTIERVQEVLFVDSIKEIL